MNATSTAAGPKQGQKTQTRIEPESAESPPPRKPKRSWTVPVPVEFIDHRQTPLKKHQKMAILSIEGFARRACFAFPSVAELAGSCGCKERQMEITLNEISDREYIEAGERKHGLGYIRRIPAELGKRRGTITLLLKRLDSDGGVFDPDGDVSEDDIRDEVHRLKTGQLPLPLDPNKCSPLRLQGAVHCAYKAQSTAPIIRRNLRNLQER